MCFTPQRRALFRYLNFQTWSEYGVLCTFWLGNVLRTPTACTFSTSQLPKVVRAWCVLCILTWKRASRHSGVHFFDISISKSAPDGPDVIFLVTFSLANVLRATMACNFSSLVWPDGSAPAALSEPTFRPSGATNHWKKHSVSWLCYLFAHLDILSSDFLLTFFWLSSDFLWLSSDFLFFDLLSSCFFLLSSFLFSSLLWLFPSLLFICP